jgi:hypothetical protein
MVPVRVVGEPAQPRVPSPPDDGGGGARRPSPRTARLHKKDEGYKCRLCLTKYCILRLWGVFFIKFNRKSLNFLGYYKNSGSVADSFSLNPDPSFGMNPDHRSRFLMTNK